MTVTVQNECEINGYKYRTKGGVTGFESLSVKNMCAGKGGWWACAGTKGRWDSLYVPADQIELIRNTLIKEEHK